MTSPGILHCRAVVYHHRIRLCLKLHLLELSLLCVCVCKRFPTRGHRNKGTDEQIKMKKIESRFIEINILCYLRAQFLRFSDFFFFSTKTFLWEMDFECCGPQLCSLVRFKDPHQCILSQGLPPFPFGLDMACLLTVIHVEVYWHFNNIHFLQYSVNTPQTLNFFLYFPLKSHSLHEWV